MPRTRSQANRPACSLRVSVPSRARGQLFYLRSGEKTADDGKAEEKDEADDTKEEEKVKDEEIKAEEDGCKMFGVFAGVCMKEPTMCDAKDNLQNSGKCMLQAARNKGKRVADRTERKRRRRLWRKLLQQGAPDGDQGLGLTVG